MKRNSQETVITRDKSINSSEVSKVPNNHMLKLMPEKGKEAAIDGLPVHTEVRAGMKLPW